MYLRNGAQEDWFYKRVRDRLCFAIIGCPKTCADGFCVSMGTNRVDGEGCLFSLSEADGGWDCVVRDDALTQIFEEHAASVSDTATPFATGNEVEVRVPAHVPNSVYGSPLWDEYTARCIGCGRCNFVCPTCTCYTMQDIFYTDNGKVGERRRVAASCMVDGYTDVAGGGQYRKAHGERMRFKVLHKIYDFSVKAILEKGFAEQNIWVSQERKMCCGLGKCGHCRIGAKYVCLDGPVFNYTDSKDMLD